ncbi:hypothetical protein G7Z17_g3136 [Cylindrodendrum hubeiense]|uniref:Uncharacterized protein n=1 Tax=Cylindrodendrum hubeiense TaxID=595255 RepID=A0A9P5LJN0_9HYPO|nr:hypothetical protein G7Z17_g3136 [Cylindrodendrum hubeiense]
MGNATADHDTNNGRAGYLAKDNVSIGEGDQYNGPVVITTHNYVVIRDCLQAQGAASGQSSRRGEGPTQPSSDSWDSWTVPEILRTTALVWLTWTACEMVKVVVPEVSWTGGQLTLDCRLRITIGA